VLQGERGRSKRHRRQEALAVAEIALAMTDDTLVLNSTELRDRGLVRLVELEILPAHDRALHILAGWSGNHPLSDLRAVLASKTERVEKWREEQPDVDAFWLLWAIWPGTIAGPEFPEDHELAKSGFDRTYQVNASNGKARLIARAPR
jgi:hypothetical protein